MGILFIDTCGKIVAGTTACIQGKFNFPGRHLQEKFLKYLYPSESEEAVLCICTLLIKVQVPKAKQILITRAQRLFLAFPMRQFVE